MSAEYTYSEEPYNEEPTPMEVLEFHTSVKYHHPWHLQCMGQSPYLSALDGMPVQHFWEKYSVKALYLKSVRNQQFLTWMGIPPM